MKATGFEVSRRAFEATGVRELGSATKDRSQFARVLSSYVRKRNVDLSGHTLIVGGSLEDVKVLRGIGFRRMTLSNIQTVSQSMIPSE